MRISTAAGKSPQSNLHTHTTTHDHPSGWPRIRGPIIKLNPQSRQPQTRLLPPALTPQPPQPPVAQLPQPQYPTSHSAFWHVSSASTARSNAIGPSLAQTASRYARVVPHARLKTAVITNPLGFHPFRQTSHALPAPQPLRGNAGDRTKTYRSVWQDVKSCSKSTPPQNPTRRLRRKRHRPSPPIESLSSLTRFRNGSLRGSYLRRMAAYDSWTRTCSRPSTTRYIPAQTCNH